MMRTALVLADDKGNVQAYIPDGELVCPENDLPYIVVGGSVVAWGVQSKVVAVPLQDISKFYKIREEGEILEASLDDLRRFSLEEEKAFIDRYTAKKINEELHPFAPVEEQIGILRDQLVHVLNALGIEPTPDFAKLNEIAIKEIEAARKKKEALDESDSA